MWTFIYIQVWTSLLASFSVTQGKYSNVWVVLHLHPRFENIPSSSMGKADYSSMQVAFHNHLLPGKSIVTINKSMQGHKQAKFEGCLIKVLIFFEVCTLVSTSQANLIKRFKNIFFYFFHNWTHNKTIFQSTFLSFFILISFNAELP